jgi:uncharacterized damage-inducible protein DinB
MDRSIIDNYARGGEKLIKAIEGLGREELLAYPVPGTWSIQQIVIHLLDSDLISMDRMKRIIAMEKPLLMGYDETAFSKKLHYDEQSAHDAVTILDLSFKNFAVVLRMVSDSAFARQGVHGERGLVTLGDYLEHMVSHLDHHLKFIYDKRKMLGK